MSQNGDFADMSLVRVPINRISQEPIAAHIIMLDSRDVLNSSIHLTCLLFRMEMQCQKFKLT